MIIIIIIIINSVARISKDLEDGTGHVKLRLAQQ